MYACDRVGVERTQFQDVGRVNVQQQILGLIHQLRQRVGTLKAKKKDGVKFKIRSADELVDRIRPAADELGILIYPVHVEGRGHVVEDGTLAEVTLTVRVQAVSDGSHVDFCGFGLGADQQDKAGGKAGTYAFKSALVQGLLAGGSEDTDDTDTPVPGGVKPKAPRAPKPTVDQVLAAVKAATDRDTYLAAVNLVKLATPETQVAVMDEFRSAKAALGL